MFPVQNHRMPKSKRISVLFLAAYASSAGIGAIAAIMPPPAYAATAETPRTRIVQYRDLNLDTDRGTATLQQRIQRAAKQVCELDGVSALMLRKKIRNCVDRARTEAWTSATQKIARYRHAIQVGS